MNSLLKLFLPYTMLAAIGVAVYVSNYHTMAEMVVVDEPPSAHEHDDEHAHEHAGNAEDAHEEGGPWRDPICRMEVNPNWGWRASFKGKVYYFCVQACRDKFVASPEDYIGDRCMVCEKRAERPRAEKAIYQGETYYLCCEEHRLEFESDPAAHFMHTMWGIPPWMYFLSIAFVLVVSFGLFEGIERLSGSASSQSPAKDRLDLLRVPPIRWMLCSRPFRFVAQTVLAGIFLLVIAAGLYGNQSPGLNIAPTLTWTVWWGGLVILIMFAGKAWCYVCPWDAIAGWMEKLRFWRKNDEGLGLGAKWPRVIRNILLATVLFVGLTWIELGFGVTMKPRATAYLGIAMLLLAIGSAFLFERKSFCRYGCLVGRVSGLYALFSGVEFRSRDKTVCKSCRTKECAAGSETAYGCPTLVYPGGMNTNTYCIQCCECLQACPHNNMAVNLRPWGSDLATAYKPRTDEAYLALLMLSITAFHGLTMTPAWGKMKQQLTETLAVGQLLSFSSGMAAVMFAPILVFAVLVHASYRLGSRTADSKDTSAAMRADLTLKYHDYFIRYAYALLPIALFYHLAHNLGHLLMEGPKVIRMASDPFGWGHNWFGTQGTTVPPLVSLDVQVTGLRKKLGEYGRWIRSVRGIGYRFEA